jgi:hypothetical protein
MNSATESEAMNSIPFISTNHDGVAPVGLFNKSQSLADSYKKFEIHMRKAKKII